MRGYAKNAFVGILMIGLLAAPNLSSATDRDGNKRHSLIQHPNNHAVEHHQHNQGGIPGYIQVLQAEIASLKADLAAAKNQLNGRLDALANGTGSTPSTNPALAELAKYVTVVQGDLKGAPGPHVIFHDANLHVQDGFGPTEARLPSTSGLGNLIVGYNEPPAQAPSSGYRNGSHNLVVGPSHVYTSTGGAVFGSNNMISGPSATVLGGELNTSSGLAASILGGKGVAVSNSDDYYP